MKSYSVFYGHSPLQPRKWRRIFLALCYCAGLLMGSIVAAQAQESIASWMRTAEFQRVSIVSLLSVTCLHFLISAAAVLIAQVRLFYPVCFLKAFSFGFCAGGVYLVFGSAGWLVCGLLLFTDLCSMPLLYLFWQRYIDGSRRLVLTDAVLPASLLFLIGSLDHCIITPFLMKITEI